MRARHALLHLRPSFCVLHFTRMLSLLLDLHVTPVPQVTLKGSIVVQILI